jgi:hypothetical protein
VRPSIAERRPLHVLQPRAALHFIAAQFIVKFLCVVGLVSPQRVTARGRSAWGSSCAITFGHASLHVSVGQCQMQVSTKKAVAVLHEPMPKEAEFRLLAFALLVEPCLRASDSSRVRTRFDQLLPMEIRLGEVRALRFSSRRSPPKAPVFEAETVCSFRHDALHRHEPQGLDHRGVTLGDRWTWRTGCGAFT